MDEESTESNGTTRNVYLSVIIVLVLIVLLLAASMLFLLQRRNTVNTFSSSPAGERTAQQAAVGVPPAPGEPMQITSRTGKVVRASSQIVTFATIAFDAQKSGYAAVEMEARITPTTLFTAVTKSSAPPLPGQTVQAASAQAISVTSIRAGDTVEVLTAENMKGKTRFDAAEIRRIIHQ